MKINFIHPLVLLLLLSIPQKMTGQKKSVQDSLVRSHSIFIIGKNYGDSVVLRWGPTNPDLWVVFNKSGYIIERFNITDNNSDKPVRERLTPSPIKPWTLEEWKIKSQRNDSMAAVAAQLLYGKSRIPVVNNKKQSTEISISEAFDQKYDMENRFSFALFMADNSPFIATGLGLRFVDKTFQKGKTYIYSIHAFSDPKQSLSDSSAIIIKTSQTEPLPDMPEIKYVESDREVKFRWSRVFADHYFSSYNYERSVDGGKTFHRINTKPYLQPMSNDNANEKDFIILSDSLPFNYVHYYYRITGITPFGDKGKPSPVMIVTGRDKTPPIAPEKLEADYVGKTNVRITWKKPIKESDLAGYMIGRSEDFNGPFTPLTLNLLNKNSTEFTDTMAITWGRNFYVVSSVDTANNAGISMPVYAVITDTIPPLKPTGLEGKIDTTGLVTLNWKLGLEHDLMGYMVYFANATDHTFAPLTKDFLVDSVFTDSISLNNLTKNIYYRIVAFDRNRNPSPYSAILELKKPDRIPPVAPVFLRFLVSDSAVSLLWVPSSSSDAVRQKLFRSNAENDWIEISDMDNIKNSYTDTKVKKMIQYSYSLIAFDNDGNHSERSFPVTLRVYDSGLREKIQSFTGKLDNSGKTITLTWNYPVKDDYYLLLYRSVNNSGLQMYESFKSDKSEFIDNKLSPGKYEYALKAIFRDGAQSPITSTVSLVVKD